MDDTARAIARLAEEKKAEKSSESRKSEAAAPKRPANSVVNGLGQRRVGGPTPQTSTKRPKSGGA